jgi:hypothetical protein
MSILFVTHAFAMDKDSFDSDKKLSAYSTIIINDFDYKDVVITHMDAEEMQELKSLLPQLVNNITEQIVKEVKNETKFKSILMNNSEITKNAVKLEGKITELNGGHGAAKFFLGVFTPKSARSYIAITGKLTDLETGKLLGTFSDTKLGWQFYKGSSGYFKEISKEIGESVGGYVEGNY